MSEQPKALRIALMLDGNECCKAYGSQGSHPPTCEECPRTAADELRRLHAANAELAEALEVYIAAFDAGNITNQRGTVGDYAGQIEKLARAALAKHKKETE